jgi:hypothetical protein
MPKKPVTFKLTSTAGKSWLALLILAGTVPSLSAQNSTSASPTASQKNQSPAVATPVPSRGIKLMLKDGSFELVREYHIEGDRVRYYNLDSSQWEVMPAALVDWDATKKVAAQDAQHESAILAKVEKQDEERSATTLDIDASLEAAPGIFLPSGVGLWEFNGHTFQALTQAEITSKLSKAHVLEQVMVPVPIIPTRHNISIKGERATMRIRTGQPEFYIRTADGRTPDLKLIRTKVHSGSRYLEHVDQLMDQEWQSANTVPIQRWEMAKGVFRITLGQPLSPGEYVLAEVLQNEQMSFYVWDFGVDANAEANIR